MEIKYREKLLEAVIRIKKFLDFMREEFIDSF